MKVKEVPIHTETIPLGVLLKLAGAVDTGGQAKQIIQSGRIQVNGETETRRGRQLLPGDRVSWEGHGEWLVVGTATSGELPDETTP